MATTKTTTPIKLLQALGALGVLLGVMGLANLFLTHLPIEAKNLDIAARMVASVDLPFKKRVEVLAELRQEQEKLLKQKAAEPYAWARLSFMRKVTLSDAKGAFAALRMSNMVSPYEPRQLPERALMWRELASEQNADERAYQNTIWQRAVALQGKQTWQVAVDKHLVKEVEHALEGGDPVLLKNWKDMEGATGQSN